MVLRKSFYIHWSAGRSPRVHEVNPGRGPSGIIEERHLLSLDLVGNFVLVVGNLMRS